MPAISLGETAATVSSDVPQPFEYEPEYFNIESDHQLASGAGAKDLFATRVRWKLGFRGLTAADLGVLRFYLGRPRTFWYKDFDGNLWEVMAIGNLPTPTTLGNHDEGGDATMEIVWVGSGSLDSSYAGLFTLDYSALDGGHTLASGLDIPIILDETLLGSGTLG